MLVRRSALIFALVAAAFPATIQANPETADRLAGEASAQAVRGDFVGAAATYRQAFREYPRPDLMCNVGVAYYKAQDLPRAHRYLDQCLGIGTSLDPTFIANVRTVLSAVEQKLAADAYKPLSLLVEPPTATTTFASGPHDEPFVGSRKLWVPYGTYRVTVHAPGFVDRTLEITADNHQLEELRIRLDAASVSQEPPPPDNPTPGPTPLPAGPAPAPARPSLLAPIVASAATGVLGGIAVGFYLAARSSADAAGADANSRAVYQEYADQARDRQHIAWGAGAVASVGAVVAGVLWYRSLRTTHVEAHASANQAGLSLVGRW